MNLFHCNLFIFGICSLQSNEVKNTDVFALAHTGIFLNIKISCQHLKCERFQASLKKKKKKEKTTSSDTGSKFPHENRSLKLIHSFPL